MKLTIVKRNNRIVSFQHTTRIIRHNSFGYIVIDTVINIWSDQVRDQVEYKVKAWDHIHNINIKLPYHMFMLQNL